MDICLLTRWKYVSMQDELINSHHGKPECIYGDVVDQLSVCLGQDCKNHA